MALSFRRSITLPTSAERYMVATRPIKYLISGGIYFWTGYMLFAVLWSGLGWRLWWAKLVASVFGWTINFILQHFWVFNNLPAKRRPVQAGIRYGVITAVDFFLDYVIVAGLLAAGITPYIGQFVSAGVLTLWNYYWYQFWVFPAKASSRKRTKAVVRYPARNRRNAHGV